MQGKPAKKKKKKKLCHGLVANLIGISWMYCRYAICCSQKGCSQYARNEGYQGVRHWGMGFVLDW